MSTDPAFHPRCKVCDRGDLVPKKVFRMSRPVVAIGFILLIPSVLGMVAATLIFFGVFSSGGIGNDKPSNTEAYSSSTSGSQSDNDFRNSCAEGVIGGVKQVSGNYPSIAAVSRICDCTLATMKGGNFTDKTAELCAERWQHGDFTMPSAREEAPYVRVYNSYTDPLGYQQALSRAEESKSESNSNSGITPLQVLGGSFAIGLGVVSFVSGLLGWLLIMKKRVLQCTVCGTTVTAS